MAGTSGDKQTNRVSEEIVSMIAARAALRVPGVSRLNEDLTDNLTKKIFGKEKIARGIGLSREPEGIGIDVYLSVEYGTKIPDLAWEIQSSVKEAVEAVTGLSVVKVNIHVQGVTLPRHHARETSQAMPEEVQATMQKTMQETSE